MINENANRCPEIVIDFYPTLLRVLFRLTRPQLFGFALRDIHIVSARVYNYGN